MRIPVIVATLGLRAGALVGLHAFSIAFYSTLTVPETHHKDLGFLAEDYT